MFLTSTLLFVNRFSKFLLHILRQTRCLIVPRKYFFYIRTVVKYMRKTIITHYETDFNSIVTCSVGWLIWNLTSHQQLRSYGCPLRKQSESNGGVDTVGEFEIVLYTRNQDQLCGNRVARANRVTDQRLYFRFTDNTVPLLPNSERGTCIKGQKWPQPN